MEIRHAMIDDAPDILTMVRAKSEFDRDLGEFSGELGTSEDLIRRHMFGLKPFAHALLAGPRRNVAGFALYYFRYSSFKGRPNMWLDDLYIHPPFRRVGTGGLLMRRLAEIAVEADCTHIAWTARDSNEVGMNFYRRIGAVIVQQIGSGVTLQIDPRELLVRLSEPSD